MNKDNDDRAPETHDNGLLDDSGVDTTSISVLGEATGHVEIVVPRDEDDDDTDDGVVAPPASIVIAKPAPTPAVTSAPAPRFEPVLDAAPARRVGELQDGAERESADLLTAHRLVDRDRFAKPEPEGTWSQVVYALSRGRINLGDGRRARERVSTDQRIAAPLAGGARFVDVLSRKGGVGKTTVTTLLGMALASVREDRVIAIDANPDRGTLADRIARSSGRNVRDLVRESETLRGYNDVSQIVSRDETRLDVLASDSGPEVVDEFAADEYRAVADVASHYYSIVLTDTGTGIVHSVMGAALDAADLLVVVAGYGVDEARLASETLTWLEANGRADLARRAIVVLDQSSPGRPPVRQEQIEAHFRSRAAHVVRIPFDPQLAAGGPVTFRHLQPATRAAARELAVAVVESLRTGASSTSPSTITSEAAR
ncbi:MinD/ParA family protein [uncultured Microbacterium sp.]|uniref:MinD/ParA family ATP-binding protein n=1 Tax=uncultured Microbacterium sp. TaxID=191216 RepID=UPI0025DD7556|nr:MinD/ParA family protein [uncultured Microbacterium sp.]